MKHFSKSTVRILAVLMAASICFSVSAPAFAADGADTASSYTASETSDLRQATAASITSVKVTYNSKEIDVTNTPGTVLEIPRLSILTFTVKSSKALSYTAGTGSVAHTGTLSTYNSSTGESRYNVTAVGALGTASGLFLDGQKIFAIKVGHTPFVCDTTMPVTKTVGQSYTFKVTAENTTDKISFHVGNGAVAATAAQPFRTEDGKSAYYFKLTAASAGRTGVYITVNGVSYYSFDIIVNAKNTSTSFTCSPSTDVTKAVGDTYSFQVTAGNTSDSLTFNVGNGSVLATSAGSPTTSNGKKIYTFRVTALKAGKTGIYVTENGGKASHVFDVTVQEKASDKKYAVLTGDGVYLRSGPGISYSVLDTLAKGSVFQVLDNSNSAWTKVTTGTGRTGYISTQFLQFTSTPGGGSAASQISISKASGTFAAGKSMFISANVQPAGSYVLWSSNNESVAKVKTDGNYCYIFGVAPGTATITGTSGSVSASCTVTVTAAAAVRFTYASPNVVTAGQTTALYATTDTARTGVQFQMDSKIYTADYVRTDSINGISTKVWKATVSGLTQGTHNYTASSKTTGSYSASGAAADIFVSTAKDFATTTQEERRASEAMLNFLAEKEGYYSSPYRDTLTTEQIPTTGYGMVLYNGDVFYNDMSETEAWASMVNDINKSSYTSAINSLRSKNNLWMSQSQADALISFGYNVGSSYFTNMSTSCTFRDVLLNAVVPPTDASASKAYKAKLINDSTLYSAASGGTSLGSVSNGSVVQVIGVSDSSKYNQQHKNVWYQVQANGKTGWMSSAYVHIDDSYNLKRDLNYTNADVFGSQMTRWCMAGGSPIAGLMYRRIQEANMYNYNDYNMDLSYAKKNPYGYTLPSI